MGSSWLNVEAWRVMGEWDAVFEVVIVVLD